MDCVTHSGVKATAYCQNCGRGLCGECVATAVLRDAVRGQILCDGCFTAWQNMQQSFMAPPPQGPNPSTAAVLGLIPGVGAMYNGQFFKGFIHVVVFAVLISITEYHGIFGIFIGAWVLYQSFEAFHTARALREGQSPPDPFGLNEVGNWLNLGARTRPPAQPDMGQGPVNPAAYTPGQAGQYPAGSGTAGYQPPYTGEPQPPYQAPYQDPFQVPLPPPPIPWQRKEPIGAIVLIALGLMFLVGQMKYAIPLLLIGLGVWLIVRRIGDSQGGSK